MRALKCLIGWLLLPACFAVSHSLFHLLYMLADGGRQTVSLSVWGLFLGFALWLFIYLVLPRPMRTYVLGHELTHALWGWVMGARIKGLKVSKDGGHVRLTRTNFLITLAPYFFPFYTVCIMLLHAGLSLFIDMHTYEPIWLGWVGLTWGFHLTFTVSMLRTRQPDIEEHGHVFSYTIIYLLNILGIGLWVVTVSDTDWNLWLGHLRTSLPSAYQWLFERATAGLAFLQR